MPDLFFYSIHQGSQSYKNDFCQVVLRKVSFPVSLGLNAALA
jgi:hypothetical protein